ncbi:hypothetical protein PNI0199_02307, partial [Streptococcus pneumoniae PNI0199]
FFFVSFLYFCFVYSLLYKNKHTNKYSKHFSVLILNENQRAN